MVTKPFIRVIRAFCFIEVVAVVVFGFVYGFDNTDGVTICLFLLAAWMLTGVIDREEE